MVWEYNLQFFAKDGEGGEKTEPATPKKLEKAREEGQAPKSQDLNTAILLLVLFGCLKIFGGYILGRFYDMFRFFYGSISDYATEDFTVARAHGLFQFGMMEITLTILPIIALAVVGAFVVNVVQVKWKVTTKPLKPKPNKINPISGLKRMFSKDKLFELLKAIVKVGVLFYVVYSALKDQWGMIINIYQLDLLSALSLIVDTVLTIAFEITAVFIVLAFADHMYQKRKFNNDMKMTKQEVKDEYKNAEGNPQIKGQIRRKMQEASRRRMMQELPEADVVVTAVVGMVGLLPTLAAIDAGKDIALANKETLVCAGQIVMQRAREKGVAILPVDSEHSAIFQCLQGAAGNRISRILLTASGGPFFGMNAQQLRHVTKAQALRHPNWNMGAKITIDSASMMNKGLELIEAMWLYDVEPDDIDIVVHRESIVHSAVEFEDGSVIAQMGNPDMRLPIQYALTYPERVPCKVPPLDLPRRHNLTFFAPDEEAFPALGLARRAAAARGNLGAVMNGANEAAVDLFLHDRIPFYRIPELVRGAMDAVDYLPEITVDDVLESDRAAREVVYSLAE